jgi:uncharacterized protein
MEGGDESAMPKPIRTLIWRLLPADGAEYFGLWRDGDGWQLRGTVVAALDNVPYRIRYGVICGADWRTQSVHVAVGSGSGEQALHLEADGAGSWRDREGTLPHLAGCLDVDLEISPATNTLPIRRLQLPVGEAAPLVAAWVRFPQLTVEPLEQEYRCTGERTYRYGDRYDLEVDELGLVSRYEGIWERIAEANG